MSEPEIRWTPTRGGKGNAWFSADYCESEDDYLDFRVAWGTLEPFGWVVQVGFVEPAVDDGFAYRQQVCATADDARDKAEHLVRTICYVWGVNPTPDQEVP